MVNDIHFLNTKSNSVSVSIEIKIDFLKCRNIHIINPISNSVSTSTCSRGHDNDCLPLERPRGLHSPGGGRGQPGVLDGQGQRFPQSALLGGRDSGPAALEGPGASGRRSAAEEESAGALLRGDGHDAQEQCSHSIKCDLS